MGISIDLGKRRTSRLTNDFCAVILHSDSQAAMRNTELRYDVSFPTAKHTAVSPLQISTV